MKKKPPTRITAIGSTAYGLLQEGQSGLVGGKTSTGVFIKTPTDKVIYLTHERFRGPLTINLGGDPYVLEDIENEMQVTMGAGELSIPAIGMCIKVITSERWCASVPETRIRSDRERKESLKVFAAEVLTIIGEDDFPELFPWLGTLARGEEKLTLKTGSKLNSIVHLQELTREGNVLKAGGVCQHLLGMGEGLTPAGDDLLLGWLLTLNRWGQVLLPDFDLQPLNKVIIQEAYEKTTTVSANLIECGTRGEGDERLLDVVDAILCDVKIQARVIENLLNWGSSSGAYAFCGMGAAIAW